jgi:hypothetical protein
MSQNGRRETWVNYLVTLWIVWAAITALLVVLMIYRSLIGLKEDDQLFLDSAENKLEAEQQALLRKLDRLKPFIRSLAVVSVLVLCAIGGIWVYRGIVGFQE